MLETQEMWVWSLGQEDPLVWEEADHSSIFPWEVPQTEKPGGLQSMVLQRVGHDWAHTHTRTHTHPIIEGQGKEIVKVYDY